MQKVMIRDMEFQFEKLDEKNFKRGAAAFRVIDKDGTETFWVNTPATIDKFDDGVATPNDGRMVAFCHSKDDAEMVAAAINVSVHVAIINNNSSPETEFEKIADMLGLDIDKMRAEIKRLKAEGKTANEVVEILKPRMDEFLTNEGKAKKDALLKEAKERGEW